MDTDARVEVAEFLPKSNKKAVTKCASDPGKRREEGTLTSLVCGTVFIVSTFCAHLLTTGVSFSIGVYHVVLLEEFGQSNGLTSWVGSLNTAALCAAGPLASWLLTRYGCCGTLMAGGLMSGAGLIITAYSTSIYFVFASYGVLTGFGFGLVFTTCVTVITFQFDKWRKFAMGVSMAGVGFGICVHPFLSSFLISVYSWRGAMLITGALSLNTCVMALLIRIATSVQRNGAQPQRKRIYTSSMDLEKSIESTFIEAEKYEADGLCSFRYLILHINNFLYCFGQSVIYTHIVAFAFKRGLAIYICSSLISIIGISNIIGRIILGSVAQHPLINVTLLYSVCYVIGGLCSFGYSLCVNYIAMIVLLAILGFSIAAYGPLLSEIVCVTVGVNQFAHAYGYLLLSNAAGTLLGAPSAGWLYDVTGVYQYSFYLGGASLIASAVVMAIPKCNKPR